MSLNILSLTSGSSGNCTIVYTENTAIMVDAGLPVREIESRIYPTEFRLDQMDGVLLTHAHSDHYRSVGSLKKRYGINIYTAKNTYTTVAAKDRKNMLSRIEEVYDFPDKIGDIEIVTFPLSHGKVIPAGSPVGFLFISGGKKIGYITDTGVVSDEIIEILHGSNKIFIEANYEDQIISMKLQDEAFRDLWWYLKWVSSDYGHLSNNQCADALSGIVTGNTEEIFLAHMSYNHINEEEDNNSPDFARKRVADALRRNSMYIPAIYITYRKGRIKNYSVLRGRI